MGISVSFTGKYISVLLYFWENIKLIRTESTSASSVQPIGVYLDCTGYFDLHFIFPIFHGNQKLRKIYHWFLRVCGLLMLILFYVNILLLYHRL